MLPMMLCICMNSINYVHHIWPLAQPGQPTTDCIKLLRMYQTFKQVLAIAIVVSNYTFPANISSVYLKLELKTICSTNSKKHRNLILTEISV